MYKGINQGINKENLKKKRKLRERQTKDTGAYSLCVWDEKMRENTKIL